LFVAVDTDVDPGELELANAPKALVPGAWGLDG
jgi:hypothetical protein